MGLPIKLRHVPSRLAAGAFIINSGLGKRHLSEEAATGLQQMAGAAFPQLTAMPAPRFGRLLSGGEIALGAALVVPLVPTWLAALGLAGFSGALLYMYTKTPGLTEEGSVRPTQEGTGIAKDVFLLGIAASLLLDEITTSD